MPRKIGLAGGLGARYGTVGRRQYVDILTGLRSKHECPRCKFRTVKRWSVGIWHCRKCGLKFSGGAYTPTTKLGEIAARATRGLMSPSTLSTELESLRAGAKVAEPMAPPAKKPRAPRKRAKAKADVSLEEKTEKANGEAASPKEDASEQAE